jgi:predicted DNA-binding transcriptional regulator YafY
MERRDRLNQIIRMVQESPRSSLDIKARFPSVSPRTIERDIEQLALEGRIQPVSQDRSRNPVWQAREAIPAIEVKWMSGRAAAAVKLMQNCMAHLLPPPFAADLQPLFLKADHALRQAHNKEYARELQTVALPDDSGGAVALDSIEHLVALRDAIRQRRRVSLRLHRGGQIPDDRLDQASPLGLLMDEQCINLVAAHDSYSTPLKISLRAIRGVELHDTPSAVPAAFDLREFA